MSMREIQDLTLERSRGQERVELAFAEVRARFSNFRPLGVRKRRLLGFMVALVPTSGPLAIDRPYLYEELFAREIDLACSLGNGKKATLRTIDAEVTEKTSSAIKPILRGGQKKWSATYTPGLAFNGEQHEDACIIEVMESGVIYLAVKTTNIDPPGLAVDWILVDLFTAMHIADRARNLGGSPEAEYALEVELHLADHESSGTVPTLNIPIQLAEFGEPNHFFLKMGSGLLQLPRYRVGPSADFARVLNTVLNDLYNAAGKGHADSVTFPV